MTEVEQGSAEWHALRVGKVTASRIADMMAKIKSGAWGASRKNYMAELIVERLTNVPAPSFVSKEMQWGTDNEAQAKAAYEFQTETDIVPGGFVPHPSIAMAGASPDGLLGESGLIEIKCPNTATHLDTLLGASIDGGYVLQMQWQMACTGRAWCDWCSFDPRVPMPMQLFIKRVHRDNKVIAELEDEVCVFLTELDRKVAELKARFGTEAMAA